MGTLDYQQSGFGGIAKGIKDYHASIARLLRHLKAEHNALFRSLSPNPNISASRFFTATIAVCANTSAASASRAAYHGDLSAGRSEMDYQKICRLSRVDYQ